MFKVINEGKCDRLNIITIGRQGEGGGPRWWSPSCSVGFMRWSPLNFGSMIEWIRGTLPPCCSGLVKSDRYSPVMSLFCTSIFCQTFKNPLRSELLLFFIEFNQVDQVVSGILITFNKFTSFPTCLFDELSRLNKPINYQS
jgi:hypothetical protein